MGNAEEVAILTAGSAFTGLLVAVLLAEALAARRRRREGRATLVSLLAQLTEARSAIQVLQAAVGSPDRVARLLEFAVIQDRVIELENRLSIKEIAYISKWLFQAATAFDHYLQAPAPVSLRLTDEALAKAHRLVRIEGALSEPFGWLRRPRATWRLRKARRALLDEDEAETLGAARALGLDVESED